MSSYDASIVTMERIRRVQNAPSIKPPPPATPVAPISDLRWFVAPLTLQWTPPPSRIPFLYSYQICVQQNGIALPPITTYRPNYSLTGLTPYTTCIISVAAVHEGRYSEGVTTPPIMIPPPGLTLFCSRLLLPPDVTPQVVLETVFYSSLCRNHSHPNRWKWMVMTVGAWNWIQQDAARINGSWLGWNWENRFIGGQTEGERMGWFVLAVQFLDELLFQAPPHLILSLSNQIRTHTEWIAWEHAVREWCALPFPVDHAMPSWTEVSGVEYEQAVDEMIMTRCAMGSAEDANVQAWSSFDSTLWFSLAMDKCRHDSSMSITHQLYLLLDLLHGCELAREWIAKWPLRKSPMAWIHQHRYGMMIPVRGGMAVRWSEWTSDTQSLITTYLSPQTVYASLFNAIMGKWGIDHISSPFSEIDQVSRIVHAVANLDIQRGEGIAPAKEESLRMGILLADSYMDRIHTLPETISTSSHSSTTDTTVADTTTLSDPPITSSDSSTTDTTNTTILSDLPPPVTISPPPSIPYTVLIQYLTPTVPSDLQVLVDKAVTIIQSLIAESHGKRLPSVSMDYDMVVEIDVQEMDPSILAHSRPTVVNTTSLPMMPLQQRVTLNSASFSRATKITARLNDQPIASLVPVLVHEMLHGMGIASYVYGTSVVGWDVMLDDSKTWYIGKKGATSAAIQAYQRLVGPQVRRIPVENSFGSGTAYSHWEEGLTNGFASERRSYNYGQGLVYHPALPYEIMSGVAGSVYYLSTITAGALQDHGYVVNGSSPFLMEYPKAHLLM